MNQDPITQILSMTSTQLSTTISQINTPSVAPGIYTVLAKLDEDKIDRLLSLKQEDENLTMRRNELSQATQPLGHHESSMAEVEAEVAQLKDKAEKEIQQAYLHSEDEDDARLLAAEINELTDQTVEDLLFYSPAGDDLMEVRQEDIQNQQWQILNSSGR